MSQRTVDWRAVLLWAPVVVVAVASQSAIGLEHPWRGGTWSIALTALLLSLPLVVSIRWPLAAVALLVAALNVQVLLGGSLHFGSFLAVLFTAYALGRRSAWVRVAIGLPLLVLGLLIALRPSWATDVGYILFPLTYASAAAALGAIVRRLNLQAEGLRALNSALAREKEVTARLAIATERVRISRELHDSIAHSLTVVALQAQDCEDAIGTDDERARRASRSVADVARAGLSDLRSTIRLLRDENPSATGPGLEQLPVLASVVEDSGLAAEVRITGDPESVPPEIGAVLFRVAQEGLTNVLRHSAATTAVVTLDVSNEATTLSVADPGPRGRPAPVSGFGLAGLSERLAELGGSLTAGPDGAGFRLAADVPLRNER